LVFLRLRAAEFRGEICFEIIFIRFLWGGATGEYGGIIFFVEYRADFDRISLLYIKGLDNEK